jgi:6-phosphogluconolactonase
MHKINPFLCFTKTLICLLAFLALPACVWAQPDGVKAYRIYVGTGKDIYQLELNLKDGAMSKPTRAAEIANPSFVAIHPNQQFLYSVSETDKGTIVAFSIDAKTGKLARLNSQSAGGSAPCHLVVDRDGKAVLAANYGSGTCTSIPILADGSLGKPVSVHQHLGKSINPGNQEGPHAHAINLDKANKFAFCNDLGIDKIMIYRFNAASAKLTPHDPPAFDTPPGSGPRHFAFHPNGKWAYINGEINMTLIACEYDADKGVLAKKQVISTLPKDEKRKKGSTAEVVVHPSGKFVYVSNRDPYNSIAIFSIDQKSGELTAVEHESNGIARPRNFAIEPTGKFMLVANQSANTVISFSINESTGKLSPSGSRVDVPDGPCCIRFVPMGK